MKKQKEIEILVRGIIQKKGKFLVCKKKGKKYCFFPGGHVDFGESAEKALIREIKEELGIPVRLSNFIGASEHQFVEEGIKRHEINLAFEGKINDTNLESKEDHLQFFWVDKKVLSQEKILPESLKKGLLDWLENGEPFWVSDL